MATRDMDDEDARLQIALARRDIGTRYEGLWSALVQQLRTYVRVAHIDLVPDSTRAEFASLPSEVRSAIKSLEALAAARWRDERHLLRRRSSPLGLELSLDNDEMLNLLETYGPYSIWVEVFGSDDSPLLANHDRGDLVIDVPREIEPAVRAAFASASVPMPAER